MRSSCETTAGTAPLEDVLQEQALQAKPPARSSVHWVYKKKGSRDDFSVVSKSLCKEDALTVRSLCHRLTTESQDPIPASSHQRSNGNRRNILQEGQSVAAKDAVRSLALRPKKDGQLSRACSRSAPAVKPSTGIAG